MIESVKLYLNDKIKIHRLTSSLVRLGYKRTQGISEVGDFVIRGELIFIYPATFDFPLRIEAVDEIIEKIVSVDPVGLRKIQNHSSVIILPFKRRGIFKKKSYQSYDPIDNFIDIYPGDYVVHVDYGIGRFIGVKKQKNETGYEQNICLEYLNHDVLYVPVRDLDKIQKYVYFSSKKPKLNKLGRKVWHAAKERAKKGIMKVAGDILELQAKRESLKGFCFSPDTDWQEKVEKMFPYKETPDQVTAVSEVKKDMENCRPMDRLLCGDVGYGKTEVALRAAFKAVMDNKQVAMLVPTTILAEQHFNNFRDRFKCFPVNIEMLSRFKTATEQAYITENLKKGNVDIVIGTHRMLSGDVHFKDLGLVIIDEEQRFGVMHKERLKRIKMLVDVLTLTATPIPRTLYLALMGGRDISVINTPPLERYPVRTTVMEFEKDVIKKAIENELARKGQVFFVHNNIYSIDSIAKKVKQIIPDARIEVGHGRLSEKELEKTMINFINGHIDILISTTIIESGIDIPNANTIFINNAENFGLADLYQLRGRVGRFNKKAYAFLIVNNIMSLTHDVQKRLSALKKYTKLGSGFKIAMQDLELRGAGNLLGTRQHGYMEQIGFDLYCRFLRSAIEQLKDG